MLSQGYVQPLGSWTMICQACKCEIPGTISAELFQEAYHRNINRGGIKCPECRAKSCKRCGMHLPEMSKDESGENVCIFCVWDEQYG